MISNMVYPQTCRVGMVVRSGLGEIGIGDWMGAKGVCTLHNYSLLISEM